MNTITLGQRLQAERKATGMTQAEFGNLAGVTYKTQGRYENETRVPTTDYLSKIAGYTDVYYILTGLRNTHPIVQEAEDSRLDINELILLIERRNSLTQAMNAILEERSILTQRIEEITQTASANVRTDKKTPNRTFG